MAKIKLILDTRKASKKANDDTYPIVLKVFHKKARMIRLSYNTSISGWDKTACRLKKSSKANKYLDTNTINIDIHKKKQVAQDFIDDLATEINNLDVDKVVDKIKSIWTLKGGKKIEENLSYHTLDNWGEVLIQRKLTANKGGTAKWYRDGIDAFKKYNSNNDIRLDEMNVSLLKRFQIDQESKENSTNTISAYMRSVRAVYNAAIKEDVYQPAKNPFEHYKIPSTSRTKKKAISKEAFSSIRTLEYEKESRLWHCKNYVLIMFNCRGMNFIDLVKLKVKDINGDRLLYGRSKTGDPLSIRLTNELKDILSYYIEGKIEEDFLFPISYDGKSESYKNYQSNRRLINKHLKIIAEDAGIKEKFTTYSIRHSWATIAKYLGVSTEIISEGLGHNSIRTTEIYLKNFENDVLDDANDLIVSL